MQINFYPVVSINEQGKRDNNEDCIYPGPQDGNQVNGLFIVCDGVGGNERGEVASSLSCQSFAAYIAQNESTDYGFDYFSDALGYVEARFDAYILENPQAKGMATTLTLAYFNPQGVSLVHIGDSRIYHLRRNAIAYQSKDHSLVNSLIATGTITEEEAKRHPQKNVILRAISGASVKPTKPDVYACTAIEEGDYFFLCSDGILEAVSDEELLEIVFEHDAAEEIAQQIRQNCEKSSGDNYSCILLKVTSVELSEEEQCEKKEKTKPIIHSLKSIEI